MRLFTSAQIRQGVRACARRIERDYAGEPLTLVGVLDGGMFFLVDLARALRLPVRIETMRLSSYGDAAVSSGEVRLTTPLAHGIEGQHVLLVDDIYDSGRTLQAATQLLAAQRPRSLELCCFLVKDVAPRAVELAVRYSVFRVPDQYVYGYGMDREGWHRNARSVYSVESSV